MFCFFNPLLSRYLTEAFSCPQILSSPFWPTLPLNNNIIKKCLSQGKKKKLESESMKSSSEVLKLALRNYSFVVAAENPKFLCTCLLLPPKDFAGFLAAARGSSEDNADLGKHPPCFLAPSLFSWAGSRNHN